MVKLLRNFVVLVHVEVMIKITTIHVVIFSNVYVWRTSLKIITRIAIYNFDMV